MTLDTVRRRLLAQGYVLDDAALCRVGPWLRWSPALCTASMLAGTLLESAALLGALALTALWGAIFARHPFDHLYEATVRRLAGTPPLPPTTPQRRFACGLASVWLLAAGAAFQAGASGLGWCLGVPLVAVAALVSTTHVCIPSLLFNALRRGGRAAER